MSRRRWVDRGEWCSWCHGCLGFDPDSGARIPVRRDGRWYFRCQVCGGRTDDADAAPTAGDVAARKADLSFEDEGWR